MNELRAAKRAGNVRKVRELRESTVALQMADDEGSTPAEELTVQDSEPEEGAEVTTPQEPIGSTEGEEVTEKAPEGA